jgi:hypothetical protein
VQIPHSPNPHLSVYSAAGAELASSKNGVTLASGTTYYVPFGGDSAVVIDVHAQWDATLVITSIEVENSCNPDATIFSVVAGEWVKDNLVGAFGSVQAVNGTVTALTVAVAGGTAGGCVYHLLTGARRGRLKVVVGGTGGVAKFTSHGKA